MIESPYQAQWQMIQTRMDVIHSLMDDPLTNEELVWQLSNQVDELVMLLANLGLEIRQTYQKNKPVSSLESDESQWLDDLMTRAQK